MKKWVLIISLVVILASFIYTSVKLADLPSTYDGVGKQIVNQTIEKTKAINSVTATVFDFRGYDTLGESFVLFTAICGTTAVLRKRKKKVGECNEK